MSERAAMDQGGSSPGAIRVGPADPRAPDALALVRASHALMEQLFPPEDNHYLDPDALSAANVVFLGARDAAGQLLGIGALVVEDNWGEVKSMFTAPVARGRGIARALLDQIEIEARRRGLRYLRLETGDALREARHLYARAGFVERGPFGDYTENGTSIFMEKALG